MIDLKDLIKAGVYFGHRSSTWSPRMKPYIWGKKGGICLIDVSKTAHQLEKAAKFLEGVTSEGKSILWIGTKKPAQAIVERLAKSLGDTHVTHRWIGGTLTNNSQVKKSVVKLLHYEDVVKKADKSHYTKKELNSFYKMTCRLQKNVGGIIDLKLPVGAVVVVDTTKEASAIREAVLERIPVVALVDTNSDPSLVDYVVPCNDDSPKSIKIVLEYLAKAAEKGKEKKVANDAEELLETAKAKKAAAEAKKAPVKAAPVKKAEPKKAEVKPKAAPKAVEAKKAEPKKAEAKPKVAAEKEEKKETVVKKTVEKKEDKKK